MTIADLLLATALITIVALLTAAAAAKLARLDGATYPTALTRAATAFAAVITLTITVAAAITTLLT
ncbi:hypothetical protein ABZ930_26750 [Streptomyces sp. NPDC046716]|uniref:hypothetical protein n=1 Tax=Streptomyces sp. NPDC046716 TaxID=3157093 RepID=UPI0033D293C9